jgi:hypothetical protein
VDGEGTNTLAGEDRWELVAATPVPTRREEYHRMFNHNCRSMFV